ncbi:hypothetical protein ABIB40_002133 [Pedobacter sp. UYP30]|uniref:DUF4202 domain-containing protein n=1 Tax=Pedobacter sp. UYP30 TaxID=1756400 RepID=UPI00339981B1
MNIKTHDERKMIATFEKFDSYNKQDLNQFIWNGKTYPQEYFMAIKLYEWVLKLDENASEALLLASRCQHLGRWEIRRDSYPMDRVGYLSWRKKLSESHATKASIILKEAKYSQSVIEEVEQIILKKGIKQNTDVQTIENALCLVFLEFQYESFYPTHQETIVNILKKSLMKMDEKGHKCAMSLPFSSEGSSYIEQAIKLL